MFGTAATAQRRRVVGAVTVRWGVAAALYAFGMALMVRGSWLPGGPSRSIGDNADGTILIATLEHWARVFSGRAVGDWLSPGWFWPAEDTLGLTDTYFLISLPYGLARAVGLGPFDSYTAAVATLATIGFWSFVALARRFGGHEGTPPAVAGALAFVFAFGALPTFKLAHGQTYTVMLAPALGLLLLAAWHAPGRGRAGRARAAAAGLLYGLLAFTAPQTAWFLGFEAGLAAAVAVALARPSSAALAALVRRVAPLAVAGAAGLALGLVPVALVYGHGPTHSRAWPEVAFYLPSLASLLDVQPGTPWHAVLHRAGIAGDPASPLAIERMLGFTPVLVASALAGLVLLGRAAGRAKPDPRDLGACAFLAVAFLGWLLTASYFRGRGHPWHLIFELVPGARTIRTPFRIQLASLLFLCLGLARASARGLAAAAAYRRAGLARTAIGAALALCVVEQIGPGPRSRVTADMAGWLGVAHRPGFPCDAFYVLPPPAGSGLPWSEYQSDAMLLSQRIGMPTINGNSSWYPPGWNLLYADRPDYPGQVLAWIDAHALRDRVCGADPRSGRWEPGVQSLLRAAGS